MMPILDQIKAFSLAIGIGFLVGTVIDLHRAWCYLVRPTRLAIHLGGILVWLVLIPASFALLLLANGGDMRIYVLMALALGVMCYFRWFSRGVFRFWRVTVRKVFQIGRLVLVLVLLPVRFMIGVICWPFKLAGFCFQKAGRFLRALGRLAGRNSCQLLSRIFPKRQPPDA